jgi:signal transduction histidine kinase
LLARYERLMDISRTLNSTLEIDRLLEYIVRAATELTDTEAASILLLDPKTGNLRFEAAVDTMGLSLESTEVPLNNSIAGWIVTYDEPLLIADVSNEPLFFSQVDESSGFTTRNLLGVPMRAHDKVIGVLEALNKHEDDPFNDEDVNTLTTLAAQAAVAIENARLFEQSDLIAEMVHELRTPLAAISATTHLLLRPELDDEQRTEFIQTIQGETKRLTRMTNDFLDLARLESGRTRLSREFYDIHDVIQQSVQTVKPQAAEREVQIATEFDPGQLPQLVGDAEKITQVVMNLLTNAIKYNLEQGSVTVRAELLDDRVQVSVSDTGVGISEASLPHIFEKFYRVADTEGYTHGTGLGLTIARSIVEAHGGEMSVESIEGQGTTFAFVLPLPPG